MQAVAGTLANMLCLGLLPLVELCDALDRHQITKATTELAHCRHEFMLAILDAYFVRLRDGGAPAFPLRCQ